MRTVCSLIGIVGVAGLAAVATAEPIFIANHSFEEPAVGPAGFTQNDVPGWSLRSGDIFQWGAFYPTVASWGYTASHGNQVLYTNENNRVQQTTSAIVTAGEETRIDVDVIPRPGYPNANYFVALYAGDQLLASLSNSVGPTPNGVPIPISLGFTPGAAHPSLGLPITIVLGSGTQVNFDNVRLNGVVPTPGSLGLAALAGLVGLRRRR